VARSSSPSFSGELIHFGAVRIRVVGSGNLQVIFNSLTEVSSAQLANILMSNPTDREPLNLSHFISQRGFLELKTTNLDDNFFITRVVIYIRPVSTGYPQ